MRGKIELFSSDKLIGLLAKLGYRIRPQFKLGRQKKLEVKVHQLQVA
jgi:hypothetical protein